MEVFEQQTVLGLAFLGLLEPSDFPWVFLFTFALPLNVCSQPPPFFPQGIKLSADVKPFVPKFAGLSVAWSESSEARVFPSCAATYYPCVQELPVPEYVSFSMSCLPGTEWGLHFEVGCT